jgi:hypothetical protein
MIKQLIQNIKLWFISDSRAHCDCVWEADGHIHYRPGSLVSIDMDDITVNKPTLLECDVCNAEFLLSKFGVSKISKK